MPAPNLSSGSPNVASREQTEMSQASAISKAPAMHGPWIAAMVGLGESQKRMVVEKSSSRISRQTSAPSGLRAICSLRSKPEEKPRPAPESTMTRTSASASRMSSASWISSSMPCQAR